MQSIEREWFSNLLCAQVMVRVDVEELGRGINRIIEMHNGRIDTHAEEEAVRRACELLLVLGGLCYHGLHQREANSFLDLPASCNWTLVRASEVKFRVVYTYLGSN